MQAMTIELIGQVITDNEDTTSEERPDGTTWEKKKRKTEAEMDGLCQPGHESHQNDEILNPCLPQQPHNQVVQWYYRQTMSMENFLFFIFF